MAQSVGHRSVNSLTRHSGRNDPTEDGDRSGPDRLLRSTIDEKRAPTELKMLVVTIEESPGPRKKTRKRATDPSMLRFKSDTRTSPCYIWNKNKMDTMMIEVAMICDRDGEGRRNDK